MSARNITLKQLRYFAVLGRELNYRKSAELLFVSQPAISVAIKQLEQELGVRLLVRDTRSVALTEAGRIWLPKVEKLLRSAESLTNEMTEWASGRTGSLRIGYLVGIGSHLLGQFMAEFEAAHPGISVEATEFDFSDPTAGLASHAVDIGMIRPPVDLDDCEVMTIEEESWVACLPRGHRFAERESLVIGELLDDPIIAAPLSAGSWRDYWIATSARGGVPANVTGVAATYESEFTAVSRGIGISFTTSEAARFYQRPGIVFIPIVDRDPVSSALAWPRDTQSGAVQVFVDYVRNATELIGRSTVVFGKP